MRAQSEETGTDVIDSRTEFRRRTRHGGAILYMGCGASTAPSPPETVVVHRNGQSAHGQSTRADPRASAFGSLRFGEEHGVIQMARELQHAMADRGCELNIINMRAGGNINKAVFSSIEYCDTFIVFGSAKYGEDTGNQACTYYEYEHAFSLRKRIILIRMIPFDEQFEELQGRVIFGANTLVLPWVVGTPMPLDLPAEITEAMGLSPDPEPEPELDASTMSSQPLFTHAAAATAAGINDDPRRIWVGNIPEKHASDQALRDAFYKALVADGDIDEGDDTGIANCTFRAKLDKKNGSWAFVDFEDTDAVGRAQLVKIVLDGQDGEQVTLDIKPAKIMEHLKKNERKVKKVLRERRTSVELGYLGQIAAAHRKKGEKVSLVSLSVGDAVEILSKSMNSWVAGVVTSVDGTVAQVQYGGSRFREVDTADPELSKYCRVLGTVSQQEEQGEEEEQTARQQQTVRDPDSAVFAEPAKPLISAYLQSVGLRHERAEDLAATLVHEGYDEADLVRDMSDESLRKVGFRDGDLVKVGRSRSQDFEESGALNGGSAE